MSVAGTIWATMSQDEILRIRRTRMVYFRPAHVLKGTWTYSDIESRFIPQFTKTAPLRYSFVKAGICEELIDEKNEMNVNSDDWAG
jgi:hypothetical protein